jgi:hypothetical protein
MRKIMKVFREHTRRAMESVEIWTFTELMRRCEEAGVRPSALLKRAGLNVSNLNRWRQGRLPTIETMRKVMRAFPKDAGRVAISNEVTTSDRKSSRPQGTAKHAAALAARATAGSGWLPVPLR